MAGRFFNTGTTIAINVSALVVSLIALRAASSTDVSA